MKGRSRFRFRYRGIMGALAQSLSNLFDKILADEETAGNANVFYDPQDLTSLRVGTDGSGGQPVVGDPVGMMLDTSPTGSQTMAEFLEGGLTEATELVLQPNDLNAAGWTLYDATAVTEMKEDWTKEFALFANLNEGSVNENILAKFVKAKMLAKKQKKVTTMKLKASDMATAAAQLQGADNRDKKAYILDKKKQEQVFEGDGPAKYVSGTYDFTWALVVQLPEKLAFARVHQLEKLFVIAMFIAFSYTLYSRIPLEVDIIRDRGKLFVETPNGLIENVYTLKLANKEQIDHRYSITVNGLEGLNLVGDDIVTIKSGELLDHPIRLQIDPKYISKPNYDISFKVQALDDESIVIDEENRFIGPAPRR